LRAFRGGTRVSNRTCLQPACVQLECRSMPTRDDAWKLLCEYTHSDSLRKHALAVEACVRAYAKRNGANEELWGNTALLHDFDYERWPNDAHSPIAEHPYQGSEILRELGYPEEMIHAILGHADYCNVARVSPLDKTLFACDELSGFLTACALVKPTKSIHDVEASSVKKKLKDKAFARGVSRDDVYKGAEELGAPLDEHIAFCIAAMRAVAPELGLNGIAAASTAS
jgi:putative nucleotidyltransferase with HDIG domain